MNTQSENPIAKLHNEMERQIPQFRIVLPPHVRPEAFARVALSAVTGNPDLLRADRRLLFMALMKAAEDGLVPDGREGAIVLYRGKPQWLPMVEGIRKMIYEGSGLTLQTKAVYPEDEFDYQEGDAQAIVHRPRPHARGSDLIAVYSIARDKSGRVVGRDVMWKEEIEQIKALSPGENTPWNNKVFYQEMAIKTVVKHHAKSLPTSQEVVRALGRDDFLYDEERLVEARKAAEEAPGKLLTPPDEFPVSLPGEPLHKEPDPVPARSAGNILDAIAGGKPVDQPKPRRSRKPKEDKAPELIVRQATNDEILDHVDGKTILEPGQYIVEGDRVTIEQGKPPYFTDTGEVFMEDENEDAKPEGGDVAVHDARQDPPQTAQEEAGKPAAPRPGGNANGAVTDATHGRASATAQMTDQEREAYQMLVRITNDLKDNPVTSKQGYLDLIERLLEGVKTPGEMQGVRDYVQISHQGKKFGVTQEELKKIASDVEQRRRP